MTAQTAKNGQTYLAQSVAAEDLRPADIVAILNETYELPSFLWCGDTQLLPPHEPVRVRRRAPDAGSPWKVKALCLPFVFVKSPAGRYQTLDVRRHQLVRLNPVYGRMVWKTLRRQKPAPLSALFRPES